VIQDVAGPSNTVPITIGVVVGVVVIVSLIGLWATKKYLQQKRLSNNHVSPQLSQVANPLQQSGDS